MRTIINFTEYKTQNTFNELQYFDNVSIESLVRRTQTSCKQKEIANNYIVIKRIFGVSSLHSRISYGELSTLKQHHLNPLEETSAMQIVQELETLRYWSNSTDEILRQNSDAIFEIRVKELKFLEANCSYMALNEILDGHEALKKYIEFIAS